MPDAYQQAIANAAALARISAHSPQSVPYKAPKAKARGAGTIVYADAKGIPSPSSGLRYPARKGSRQKVVSKSERARMAAEAKEPERKGLSREMLAERLRQSRAEFDALG